MMTLEQNEFLTQVGPGTPMGDLFRQFWLPACMSEELPEPDGPPIRVTLLGERLVAFRDTSGMVGLVEEACPHRTASLYFGRNEECGIRCTYHGWKFDRTGACLDMPNETPGARFVDRVRLTAYRTEERGGFVWAYLGPDEDVPPLPRFEWAEIPDDQRFIAKTEIACNFLQGMEGDIDSSHTVFLHGKVERDEVAEGSATEFRSEVLRRFSFADRSPKYSVVDTDAGFMAAARREGGRDHFYWRVTHWVFPSHSIIPREAGALMRVNMRVPIDDHRHWHVRVQYRPDGPLTEQEVAQFSSGGDIFQAVVPGTYAPVQNLENDFLIDRDLQRTETYSGIKGIPTQDQSVTVSMGPVADRRKEHLTTSDLAIVHARRLLRKQAERLQSGERLTVARGGDAFYLRGVALLLDRDVAIEDGVATAIDPRQPWHPDVSWAAVDPVLDS